jgi:Flp pilus assembly protein TadD
MKTKVGAVIVAGLLCVLVASPASFAAEVRDKAGIGSARQVSAGGRTRAAATAAAAAAPLLPGLFQSVQAEPGNLDLRRRLAETLMSAGYAAKAVEHMRLILSSAGSNARDLTLLGEACRYSGDLAGADAAYRQALTLAPLDAEARSGLAITCAGRGDWQGAQELCRNGLAQIADPLGRSELASTLRYIDTMKTKAAAGTALPIATSRASIIK